MCTTNVSDVPVEIREDKMVRFCEGYAGIKITNGKLICNTRLRRQLLKKASCVLHCYAGFIFPLKRHWYLTPHRHHRHPPNTHTRTRAALQIISCSSRLCFLYFRASASLCLPWVPLQLCRDSRRAPVLLQQRLRGRCRRKDVQRWAWDLLQIYSRRDGLNFTSRFTPTSCLLTVLCAWEDARRED